MIGHTFEFHFFLFCTAFVTHINNKKKVMSNDDMMVYNYNYYIDDVMMVKKGKKLKYISQTTLKNLIPLINFFLINLLPYYNNNG